MTNPTVEETTNAFYQLAWSEVQIPTRDGVSLAANLYRPDGEGRFPVIVTMSPYGKDLHFTEFAHWHEWETEDGDTFLRGGPGSFMFVPKHIPHAFANRSGKPAKMFFQSSVKGGHEEYFEELSAPLRRTNSRPSESETEDLGERYDTEQITPLRDH